MAKKGARKSQNRHHKGGKKNRKWSRNKDWCAAYRARGQREINRKRNLARQERIRARRRRRIEARVNRFSVNSSNITSIGWEEGVLEVEFKRGQVYQYQDVPEYVFQEVLHAASPGKALQSQVIGKYQEAKA